MYSPNRKLRLIIELRSRQSQMAHRCFQRGFLRDVRFLELSEVRLSSVIKLIYSSCDHLRNFAARHVFVMANKFHGFALHASLRPRLSIWSVPRQAAAQSVAPRERSRQHRACVFCFFGAPLSTEGLLRWKDAEIIGYSCR